MVNASWWNITDHLFCSVTFTTLYVLWSFKSYFQFLDFMFYNLVSLRILSVIGFSIHYSFYFKLSNFWSLLPHFLMTVFLLCLATASELRVCILRFAWLLVFSLSLWIPLHDYLRCHSQLLKPRFWYSQSPNVSTPCYLHKHQCNVGGQNLFVNLHSRWNCTQTQFSHGELLQSSTIHQDPL